jgi:hypothetical protein
MNGIHEAQMCEDAQNVNHFIGTGRKKRKHHDEIKILCVCEICGAEIGRFYPSQKRRTCSKECYKKLISVLVSGDYNPNYKNGKFYITNNCEICNKDIDPRSKRCAQCKKHGNRYNTKQGYVLVRDRKHPNKNHNNDVCEHIMIMASAIKRPIIKGEIVHHINFIRNDNTITNLHLYESISAHSKCIKGIFKLVKPLLDLKIIEFREGEYFMYSTTERGGALIGGEPA